MRLSSLVAAALLALSALASPAAAQSSYLKDVITGAPLATTPFGPDDVVPVIQNDTTKHYPVLSITPGMLPDASNASLPTAPNYILGNTTAHLYFAQAYGSCTWDASNDVGPCINAAITAASAAGGGDVMLPAGDFGIASTIALPISGKVGLVGAGDAGNSGGTILRALAGLTGGVMLAGGNDTSASFIVRNVQIRRIRFACNNLAATGIYGRSWQQFRVEDITIVSCTSKSIDIGVGAVNAFGMAFGVFDNILISNETAASAGAHSIAIAQSTGTADDLHSVTFSNIRSTGQNGDGFRCGQADGILLVRFMHSITGGGTGAAARILAHDTAASVCRKVHFVNPSFGSGGGAGQGLVVQGTESAANAAWNITVDQALKGDGQPNPTVGTGVTGFVCSQMDGQMCSGSQPIANFQFRPPVINKTSTYTITSNDCGKAFNNRAGSGSQTFILPAASGSGCTVHLDKWSSGSQVVLSADSAASIAVPGANITPLVTTGDTHSSTTLDNLASTANVFVGMTVSGTGIPAGTTVTAIGGGTSVTLSQAATATASGIAVTFHAAVRSSNNFAKIAMQDQNDNQWVAIEAVGLWRTSAGSALQFGLPTDSNGALKDVPNASYLVSTAALTKTSDTTLETVPGLSLTLTAGKTYSCRGHLRVNASGAAGGIKVALVGDGTLSATQANWEGVNFNGTTTNARTISTGVSGATPIGEATAVVTTVEIWGAIVVNAGGVLAVQAAQNASSGTATTVGTNSTFECIRVN